MWTFSPGQGGRFGKESLQEIPLHTNTLSLTDERQGRHPVLHAPLPLMQAANGWGYVRPRSPAEGLNGGEDGRQEGRRDRLADQVDYLGWLTQTISCIAIQLQNFYEKLYYITLYLILSVLWNENMHSCEIWKWPFSQNALNITLVIYIWII